MRFFIAHTLRHTPRRIALLAGGLVILLSAATAHAEIVYVDLATDLYLDTPSESIPLDFNSDGQTDFRLFYDLYQGNAFLHINIPSNFHSSNKIVVTGNMNVFGKDEVRGLNEGVTISSLSTFNSSVFGNGPLMAQPSSAGGDILEGLGKKYVGFMFDISGQTHFGWMEVEVDGSGSLCTVYSYAYETTPNESIDAGDIGVTPVESIHVEGELGMSSIDTPGGQLLMVATITPADATDNSVTWSVDNESVATIDQQGILTAKSNGTVVVTATANDGSGVSGSTDIEVTNQTVLVESIVVSGSGGETSIEQPNGTLQMIATIMPDNASDQSVVWSVDDESVATIDQQGILTAKSNGTVEVTATAQDASNASGSIDIEIANQPVLVEEITVEGSGGLSKIDEPGGTLQMVAMIAPANATDQSVTWSVDNTDLATISPTGILTAKANGDVRVTATAADGSGVSGSTTIAIANQTSMSVTERNMLDRRLSGVDDGSIVTDGAIEVQWEGSLQTDARVELLSATGKIVRSESIGRTRSAFSIPTGGLLSGLYIVRVISNGKMSSPRRVLILGR